MYLILNKTLMTNRDDMLKEALKNIEKEFGKWAIMKLGDNTWNGSINTFHSWSYILDTILWGWYPEWRIIEIYWPESSWKTTLALHAIAEVQKRWEIAAFIDAEHALDPAYAQKLWINIDELIVSQPDYGEQWLQIAEELAKTWAVKLIVVDSVAALVPRSEVEWDMWDSFMWLQARMMSQWLRKLTSILSKTWTAIIFINQIRLKIWVLFGSPETTTWWNALKFFASQRIEIRRWEKLEESKEQIWYVAKVKVVKNKIAPPFKTWEIVVKFNKWIDSDLDMIEAWILFGNITRAWAFYTIGKEKIQWKDRLLGLLQSDEKTRKQLKSDIENRVKEIRLGKAIIPVETVEENLEENE